MRCQPGVSATETLYRTMSLLSGNISGTALDIIRMVISTVSLKQRDLFFINIHTHTHKHIYIFKNAATKGLQTTIKHCLIPNGV